MYTRGLSNPPGVTAELKHKRVIYACLSLGVVVVSLLLAIPATLHVSGWLGMGGLAECHIHVLFYSVSTPLFELNPQNCVGCTCQ